MKITVVFTLLALALSGEIARGQDEVSLWREPSIAWRADPRSPAMGALSLDQEPQQAVASPWLADRGEGVHTSQFGTYIREHELLVYLFYEYTVNRDNEYKPEELGFVGTRDFTAKRVDHETLLYAAYGITKDLMVEIESAIWTTATQTKASQDTSAMPRHLTEQGLGDTEGQIRWRFFHETEDLPEALVFFEAVLPLQRRKVLIGTQAYEFALEFVVTKGFSWGTLSAKFGYSYDRADKESDFGEYAIEYVKKLSDSWRLVLSVEGSQDEVEGIVEFQWRPWPNVMIKLNNSFGITPKAPDWAPEVGIMFSF